MALRRTVMRAAESSPTPFGLSGARIDTSVRFTDTGGSGQDATVLSSSLAEAYGKARALYHDALKEIPNIRKNFTIVEDSSLVRAVIRDLFDRYRGVKDPKIVDMLVFKGRQELNEIRAQWKGRHHLYQYIHSYEEKTLRHEAAQKAEGEVTEGKGTSKGEGLEAMHDSRHMNLLKQWRDRGQIPSEVENWAQYLKWKEEEENKFGHFATDAGLFTKDQLEANRKTSQCSIM